MTNVIIITPETFLKPNLTEDTDVQDKIEIMTEDRKVLEKSFRDQSKKFCDELKREFKNEYSEVISALKSKFDVTVDFEYDDFEYDDYDSYSIIAFINIGSHDSVASLEINYEIDKDIMCEMPLYIAVQELRGKLKKLESDMEPLFDKKYAARKATPVSLEEVADKIRELLKSE